ncbi:MAG: hypothetical protein M1564_00270 [Candidatus Marsarchaeota archaeon]|jgi:hypothetical protein|nr:hypothetical protein [Candidatus Marsarchaeota archaeon]MCL5430723.1 hypothetical protein [Candidatus Marsarchaeota archaeon]
MAGKTRRAVLMAGYGWIGAGVVSLFTWHIIVIRHLPSSNPNGMLYLGAFVLVVGIAILAARRCIDALIDRKTAEAKSKKDAKVEPPENAATK